MSAAKFSAGQSVRFQAPSITRKHGQEGYSVVRVMPLDGEEYEYRIKSPAELYERVAKESQLTLVREEWCEGAPKAHGAVSGERRGTGTDLARSSPQQPRTERHTKADDATWLDNWCAQRIITVPIDRDAG